MAGVSAQALARHVRLPGIVVLLAVGAGVGPDGLGWIDPSELGSGLFSIVELAVAVILFEGSMNLELSRLRRASRPIRRLVTSGAAITLVGGTVTAIWVLAWPWERSLLFGALVVVTGPTVVGPLVRDLRLRPKLATVLEAEGVMIDPVGALLAALALTVALAPEASTVRLAVTDFAMRAGFGAVAGALGGGLLGWLLRHGSLIPDGQSNILALASVLFLFEGCESLVPTSGILAVTIAGIVVGNVDVPEAEARELREFKDQLTVMLIGLLFVLLAADVRIADVRALGARGVAVVAALLFVIRPLCVAWSTRGSDLDLRERMFLSWIAPRGIVAAAVASVTASELARAGMPGGDELRALVFLTIGVTVLLAGVTALPVSSWLDVRLPGRDRVSILGAQGLGLLLAEELRRAGGTVVFLDSNPQNCRRAEEAGFSVVFGNALEERTLQRARFESVGTAIGLTPNETLNGLFITRAHELFDVPSGYVALERLHSGVTQEFISSRDADALFEDGHDVERWDVRVRHGETLVEPFVYRGPGGPAEFAEASGRANQERFVILAHQRGQKVRPMSVGLALREGDRVAVAIHKPERAEARARLAERGFQPEAADSEGASAELA